MSGKRYFVDKHGNGHLMEFIKVSNPEYVQKRISENPTNSEHAKKPKLACPNEENIQTYLENKLKQVQGLARCDLETLAMGILSELIDEHMKSDDLLRKYNKTKQDLISARIKYHNLESQISQISSSITNIRQKFHELETQANKVSCMENNVLHRTPIKCTVRDVGLVDLTGEDESASPNVVTSSEQVPIVEEKSSPGVADAATPKQEPSSSQRSQTRSEGFVNIQHPAPLPVLPIIYFIEPSSKTIAPAPEVKTQLVQDKVALTWFSREQDLSAYEPIVIYQVYCYKETSAPPSTFNWKKLVELTALPLPMTCYVGKCTVGRYYFAVRGIDIQLRVGPFSSPVSITFQDGGVAPRNLNA